MPTGINNIEAAIKTLIDGMSTPTFNFNWSPSNIPDKSKGGTFPNALIFVLGEENDDPEEGSHSQAYHNRLNIQIVVRSKLSTVESEANFAINTEHNKALVDLKKLFGTNEHLNDTANSILYQSMTRNISGSGDLFKPGDMITEWMVRYSQDRIDPTVNAN